MDVSAVNGPSPQVNVKLQKGQQEQKAKVVSTLIEGAVEVKNNSRSNFESGQNLNIKA